jgi:hypothetical protein
VLSLGAGTGTRTSRTKARKDVKALGNRNTSTGFNFSYHLRGKKG